MSQKRNIIWTDYIKYRAKLRGFELDKIEEILRYSSERYFDVSTGRHIVVGRHDRILVVIPYTMDEEVMIPITIHATTRQQINFRIKTKRYIHE